MTTLEPSCPPSPHSDEGQLPRRSRDIFVRCARPLFLYVMYAIILWSLPISLVAAVSPLTAAAMAKATGDYLTGLPEPLMALFGTGYLGYATLRQWGKTRGSDR